ncbi:MAG: gliding motility-associated C-terminal domain-containing protein [Bacteroidales bacterium]
MRISLHIVLLLILGMLLPGSASSQDTIVCGDERGMYAVSSDYSFNSIFRWEVEGGEKIHDYGNKIEVKWDDNAAEGRISVTEISVMGPEGGCEGGTKEYVVDIRNTFADLGTDEEICEGESVEFSPGSEFKSYEWQDGSTQSYYTADSAGTYWVKVKDQHGCVNRDKVNLTVHDNPDVNIEVNTPYMDDVQIFEDSVTFIAGAVDYISLDAGMWSSYEWNTGDMMASIDVEDTDVARATAKTETERYWVTVSNEYGCTSTDSIAVTVIGNLEIPNAFTPNDDQVNDEWKIPGLSLYPNCVVEIYDRWGNRVYHSKGYNEADYWDGTGQNGKKLPMDSYYYIIKLGNGEEPIEGTVSIIR